MTKRANNSKSVGGLYIHIPFCLKKCPYCDFYSITDLSKKEAYIRALISEMALTRETAPAFDTIYLGGGTPSVLSGREVERILTAARSRYHILPGVEVTLEVNPGTVSTDALHAYRKAGVNRISLGVQSFNDRILETLGRIHTAEEAIRALQDISDSDFASVGIDLIYGVPGQQMDDWRNDLAGAVSVEPDHVSAYMLSFEPGTRLNADRRVGRVDALPEASVADMFRTTVAELARYGYCQYEISNFSRPGRESRHNVKYWNGAPYLGLGAGAHSFDGAARWWQFRDIDRYVRSLATGKHSVSGKERLTRPQQMMEAIYLGLRTTAGIRKKEFESRFEVNFQRLFDNFIADLEDQGLFYPNPDRVTLTVEGMLLLDAIVGQMTDRIEN